MPAKRSRSSLKRIATTRRIRASVGGDAEQRAEYNRIIDALNIRGVTHNEVRDAIVELHQASDIQFRRIAQMQAEIDLIRAKLAS